MIAEKVVYLPIKKSVAKNTGKTPSNGSGIKYFTEREIKLLRRTVREKAELGVFTTK